MKAQTSAWLPIQVAEPTDVERAPGAFDAMELMSATATTAEPHVWPAHLPAGARWLPYSAQPARVSPTFEPLPAPQPAPRPPLPLHFWRLLLAAMLGAGLFGILGGLAAGMLMGAH